MAIRREDLHIERGAVVVPFPTRRVRGAVARRARMEARRRRTITVALALGLVILFLLATGPGGSLSASVSGAPRAVTVHEGDTLWSLAEKHAPEGMDPRAYVDLLQELNGLQGELPSGMRVKLPR